MDEEKVRILDISSLVKHIPVLIVRVALGVLIRSLGHTFTMQISKTILT